MKVGVTFPQTEIGADPAVIRDWAQAAEGLGLEQFLIYDHVLGAVHEGREPPLTGPYTEQTAFHEPFVTLSYFAALTSRIMLTTGVIILPQRRAQHHGRRPRQPARPHRRPAQVRRGRPALGARRAAR